MNEEISGIGSDEFRAALSRFPTGVTIVTSRDAGGSDHGITVSAFSSVSLDPPMILVCIEKTTGSHDVLLHNDHFGVNILAEGKDAISNRFASRNPDKFDGVSCRTTPNEIVVFEDALVALECRRIHSYEGGDHTIFVGLVEKTTIRDEAPLVYWQGEYRKLTE